MSAVAAENVAKPTGLNDFDRRLWPKSVSSSDRSPPPTADSIERAPTSSLPVNKKAASITEESRTRVVLRRLPAELDRYEFYEKVGDWISPETCFDEYFTPGHLSKRGSKPPVLGQAYAHFRNKEYLQIFLKQFGPSVQKEFGRLALLEYAPMQLPLDFWSPGHTKAEDNSVKEAGDISSPSAAGKDPLEATISESPNFLDFVAHVKDSSQPLLTLEESLKAKPIVPTKSAKSRAKSKAAKKKANSEGKGEPVSGSKKDPSKKSPSVDQSHGQQSDKSKKSKRKAKGKKSSAEKAAGDNNNSKLTTEQISKQPTQGRPQPSSNISTVPQTPNLAIEGKAASPHVPATQTSAENASSPSTSGKKKRSRKSRAPANKDQAPTAAIGEPSNSNTSQDKQASPAAEKGPGKAREKPPRKPRSSKSKSKKNTDTAGTSAPLPPPSTGNAAP